MTLMISANIMGFDVVFIPGRKRFMYIMKSTCPRNSETYHLILFQLIFVCLLVFEPICNCSLNSIKMKF